MKHIRTITTAKASDSFGYFFLQIWLTAFFTLLQGALGASKDK